MKILHIEDSLICIGGAQKTFFSYDYKYAVSAKNALEILEHSHFDVIICDGRIQGEMTGWELVKNLRSKGLKTPIIACSNGYNDEILAAGANAFADKNFNSHEYEFVWHPVFQELGLI